MGSLANPVIGGAQPSRSGSTLNEGRGTHPGDTRLGRLVRVLVRHRSTKAGARTPATLVPRAMRMSHGARSTKAGARTPATPPRRDSAPCRPCGPLKRRPGHAPRRHFLPAASSSRGSNAQRRPGHAPRRHASGRVRSKMAEPAQRRPGHAPRRHADRRRRSPRPGRPLNEGRGTHPGDTPEPSEEPPDA